MTTRLPNDIPYLYLAQDDLLRLGNASVPRLDHVRSDDVNTYERNGVHLVMANGKGTSLSTKEALLGCEAAGFGGFLEEPSFHGSRAL